MDLLVNLGNLGVAGALLAWCLTQGTSLLKELSLSMRELRESNEETKKALLILVAVQQSSNFSQAGSDISNVAEVTSAATGVVLEERPKVAAASIRKTATAGTRRRAASSAAAD